jgi:hypothetical protein
LLIVDCGGAGGLLLFVCGFPAHCGVDEVDSALCGWCVVGVVADGGSSVAVVVAEGALVDGGLGVGVV